LQIEPAGAVITVRPDRERSATGVRFSFVSFAGYRALHVDLQRVCTALCPR
jgi:hypothetical protein